MGNRKLEKALARLLSEDDEAYDQTLDEISELMRTREDGLLVLEAATKNYPDRGSWRATNAVLLRNFNGFHHPDFIPVMELIYDRLHDKGEAREIVLRALMNMKTESAFRAVGRLLARPSSKDVELHTSLYIHLRDTPRLGLSLFPQLFEVIPNLDNRASVYEVILKYVEEGLLDLNRHPQFRDYCLSRTKALLTPEYAAPAADASQEEQRRHAVAFQELEMLLDLLRFLDAPSVNSLLSEALNKAKVFPGFEGESERLKILAAGSLLVRRQAVDARLLERLAQIPALRHRLWEHLGTVKRLDAFPQRYRNQRDLAEAEMVLWLEHPSEMSRVPENIGLLRIAEYDDAEGLRQALYCFKFRHQDFLEGKWFFGVAGPYPAQGPPRIGGDNTFTRFKELDEKRLQAHLREYLPEDARNVTWRE